MLLGKMETRSCGTRHAQRQTVREAGQLDARALATGAPPHESPMFTTNKRPYGEVEQVGKREILLLLVI